MKRILTYVVMVLSLWLLLAGMSQVLAEGPQPMATASTLALDLDVQPNGAWALSFGGLDMGIDSSSFDSLSQRMGWGMAAPVIQPEMIATAVSNDIQHVALVKEGKRTTVLINSQPALALTISDAAVAALGDYVPEVAGLISWLNESNTSLAVHLPPKDPAMLYISDMSPRVEARPIYEPVNYLRLEATMSRQGVPLSVGGMGVDELGLNLAAVDVSMLNQLGIEQLIVDLDSYGAVISANGQEWLRVDINADFIAKNSETLASLLAVKHDPQINSLIKSWVEGTHISVALNISDTSRDVAPEIQLGRPLMVEVAADNSVRVEGLETFTVLDEQTAGLARMFGSAAVTWDGANGQLRMVAGDTQLPYLELDEGFLQTLGDTVLADALPIDVAMIDGVLGKTSFSIGVNAEGVAPPRMELLDYAAQRSTAGYVRVVPQLTLAPNSIAVYGEPLPLDLVTQYAGVDVVGAVAPYREAYGTKISTAGVYLGPEGLRVTINGSNARLRWDATTRSNLVNLGMKVAGTQMNLPGGVGWQLTQIAAQGAANVFSLAEVGVEVNFSDQNLAPGFLQSVAYTIFPQPLPQTGQ